MSADEADRGARSGDPSSEAAAVPPETAAEPTELEQTRQALAQAEERARNNWEQYLRAVAELDNVRKRAQRDMENAARYGLEKFAADLLPVKDSLELGVQSAQRSGVESLAQGQEATLQLLAKAFARHGISEIDPAGEPFDPGRHEAMMTQESATAEPGSVLQVVQKGYALNGRLLRPARVIVAKAPAQNASEKAQNASEHT